MIADLVTDASIARALSANSLAAVSPLAGFEFARPSALAWLALVAVGALLLVAGIVWRRRALARLADQRLLASIAPRIVGARVGARAVLVVAAMAAVAVALGDPRAGERAEEVEQRGVDAMIVIDVSRSMLAEDAAPNRLGRARQFAADLVDALGSDRVGLVEFAGVPALRCPLTFNHRAFRSQLELLSPQSTVRGGSMLGDAIRLAAAGLPQDGAGKAIVIFSDGEDMESEPVEAAATALKDRGIRTITVGIGDTAEGARIPEADATGGKRFVVYDGQEVWSKMDPRLLKAVADAGDGFFIEAGTGQADMRQAAAYLATALEKRTRERTDVPTKDPLFQWLALAALAALIGETLVRPRRAVVARKAQTEPGGSTA